MQNLYSVKSIKRFIGMEGYGFNANLYLNNNKIAFVYDDASGGEINFQFENPQLEKDFQGFAVLTLGAEFDPYSMAEILVNDMVNESLQRKDLKALLAKKTVCKDKDGLFTLKTKFIGNEERVINHIATKEKGAVLLNNIPFENAYTLYMGA